MPANRPIAEDAKPGTCPIEMSDEKPCGRPLYDAPDNADSNTVCILHSTSNRKSKTEFKKEVETILDGRSTNNRISHRHDFTSVIFNEYSF